MKLTRSVALVACVLLAACSSTKPPAPVSELRAKARQDMEAGHAAYERRNGASAAAAFGRAAARYAAMDDDGAQAIALVNQGQSLLQSGQEPAALEVFETARTLAVRVESPLTEAACLAGIARCQRQSGQSEAAVASLKRALALATSSQPVMATLHNDLAVILMASQPDDAVTLLHAALSINESLRRDRDIAVNHLNLGRVHMQQNHREHAGRHLSEAWDRFRALDDPTGLAQTHESLAMFHQAGNDQSRAQFHREQARQKYEFLKDQKGLERLARWQP